MVDENTRVQLLHEHYNASFENVRAHIRTRDRLFLALLALAVVMLFQMAFPAQAATELGTQLVKTLGLSQPIEAGFLNSLVWFCMLCLIVRYGQATVYVERQYHYLDGLEARINALGEANDVTREGKSYLKNYPLFSDWTHFLYTTVFPLILGVLLVYRIESEIASVSAFSWRLVVDGLLCGGCLVSIVLYLVHIYFKR